MKYKFKIVWILVLILYRTAAIGDMAPFIPQASGGAVSPVSGHASIRMDSERVIIRLAEDGYSVDAEFLLYNTGETVSEPVGFPKIDYTVTQRQKGPTDYIRFETWVNGEKAEIISNDPEDRASRDKLSYNTEEGSLGSSEIELSKREGIPPLRDRLWLVHRVKFPGHAYTKIRAKYQSQYSVQGGLVDAIYVVGTGRYWKDRIGKAVFIIDSSAVGGAENIRIPSAMAPGPRLISAGLQICEISNFRPGPREALTVRVLKTKESLDRVWGKLKFRL
jgi:hypothetical protein